jgi:PAS domain S-box-containing protein
VTFVKVTRRDRVRKLSHDDAISIAPSKGKSKRVGRASHPLRDITERKLVEKALRESEAKYRTLVEQSLQGILIGQGLPPRIVFANPAIAKTLGYTPDELTSLSPKETERLVHPEDRALFFGRFRDRLQGRPAPPRYEVRGVRKDGEVRWLEISSNRIEYQRQPAVQATLVDITERKRTEEALLEKERLLSESQRIARVGSWVYDLSGRLSWSDEMYRIYGVSKDTFALSVDSFLNLIHPEDRPAMQAWIAACLAGEKPRELEFRIIMPDGTIRFVSGRGELKCDAEGKPIHVAGTAQEIPERKRLQEERDRIFNLSIDMLCIAGFDGYFKRLNPAWEKTVGWTSQELMSKPYLDFVHPEDREATINAAQDLSKGKKVLSFDNRYLCKDGTYKWVSWSAVPFTEEQLIVCVARDITERKQMEDRVRESEEQFRSLFESAADGILVADPDAKYLILGNKSISQMLGYSQEEIKNLRVIDIFPEKDLPRILDLFEKAARREITGASNIPLKGRDGTVAFVDISAFFITLGGKTLMAGFFRDVTERKRIENMKDQFMSAVTHELRTPLVPIKANVDFVLSGKLGPLPEKIAVSLQLVKRNTDRLASLTDELLDIRRLESGRFQLNFEPLDFRDIINQSIREMQAAIDLKKQSLRMTIPDEPLPIHGDSARLSQVMLNLLANASKFTPENGSITVKAEEEADAVKVQISDTGIGIKAEDLVKVFEPFSTIQKATYSKGTGLGLSITKVLVEAHGGKIWVESAGEGKGATFAFTIHKEKKGAD